MEPKGAQALFCGFQKGYAAEKSDWYTKIHMDDPQAAPSNIVINGEEFSPEDAQALIETGRKTREYEQKWNTKLDAVWPEYGKLSGERSAWEKEKADLTSQLETFKSKQDAGTETTVDVEKAKEAARKLGLSFNEDLEKSGYVKKDDLEKYLSERDQRSAAIKAIHDKGDALEKEINGEDGRPKFNKKMVMAWAAAYGKTDLMEAYKDMHKDEIDAWEKSKIEEKKNPSLKTFKPAGGKKEPGDIKVGDDNVKGLLKETLWGNKE